MSMIHVGALRELITKINLAPPCRTHGREHLAVCLECRETVYCHACDPMPCQCRNDE